MQGTAKATYAQSPLFSAFTFFFLHAYALFHRSAETMAGSSNGDMQLANESVPAVTRRRASRRQRSIRRAAAATENTLATERTEMQVQTNQPGVTEQRARRNTIRRRRRSRQEAMSDGSATDAVGASVGPAPIANENPDPDGESSAGGGRGNGAGRGGRSTDAGRGRGRGRRGGRQAGAGRPSNGGSQRVKTFDMTAFKDRDPGYVDGLRSWRRRDGGSTNGVTRVSTKGLQRPYTRQRGPRLDPTQNIREICLPGRTGSNDCKSPLADTKQGKETCKTRGIYSKLDG